MSASSTEGTPSAMTATANGSDYSAKNIRVLKGLEGPRMRPDMYIGDTGFKGFHHMLWEILDNSVDEAMGGFADDILVALYADGSASVRDNGRGIPVDIIESEGLPACTVAMTQLHAGGKFGDGAYKTSGGLHGVGASVVNALSTRFELRIRRDGFHWEQVFENGGTPTTDLVKGKATKEHGTETRFWPDPTIFTEVQAFDVPTVQKRLQNTSYLNPGLRIILKIEETNEEFVYFAEQFAEILDFIAPVETMKDCISPTIEAHRVQETDKGAVEVFVAFRYHATDDSTIASFANNITTPYGGTHETGFRSALLRAINQYGTSNNILKEPLTADDVREGLAAAIAVRVGNPKFEGQTKEKLGNSEANGAVSSVVYQTLSTFFEENPSHAKAIVNKAVLAAKAREAAQRARDLVVKRKDALFGGALPGKLVDCQSNRPEECEIFLVEGDSAGGTAKGGRNAKTQAILPLRGKIQNIQKLEAAKALKSEQIQNLILALGCGVGAHYDREKLRYHKVIIMTDADVDGAHICTLLMTFFNMHMPQLIRDGNLYVAMPPLFKAVKGKKSLYIQDDAALTAFLSDKRDGEWTIQRFKGLGEMDAKELAETTMRPDTRRIGRINYGPEEQRVQTEMLFETLMGGDVAPRREFIEKNAHLADISV